MKIVFEGIDCAGKTTIAKSVAGQINAVHFPTPNGIFRKMRDCLNQLFSQHTGSLRFLRSFGTECIF